MQCLSKRSRYLCKLYQDDAIAIFKIITIVVIAIGLTFIVSSFCVCAIPLSEDCVTPNFEHPLCDLERHGICDGRISWKGIANLIMMDIIFLFLIFLIVVFVVMIYKNIKEYGLSTVILGTLGVVTSLYLMFVLAFYASSLFSQYVNPVDTTKNVSCHEVSTYHVMCQLFGILIEMITGFLLVLAMVCLYGCFKCFRSYHQEKIGEVEMHMVHVDR